MLKKKDKKKTMSKVFKDVFSNLEESLLGKVLDL